ncbi:MAG TPA: hypothetical protein VFC07_07300 [Verrucomicrobiae bacterium]|nr:hypothetical protein [Verrucomicrobiae bacterium]
MLPIVLVLNPHPTAPVAAGVPPAVEGWRLAARLVAPYSTAAADPMLRTTTGKRRNPTTPFGVETLSIW